MKQMEDVLQDLSNLTDIKTGKINSMLTIVYKKLVAYRDELKQKAKK